MRTPGALRWREVARGRSGSCRRAPGLRPAHSPRLGALGHCRRGYRDHRRHPRPRSGQQTNSTAWACGVCSSAGSSSRTWSSGILAWWRRPASRLGPLMWPPVSRRRWPRCSGRPAAAVQHRSSVRHAAGGDVPARLPGLSDRTADQAAGAGRGVACYAAVLGLQIVKIMLGVNPDNVFAVIDQRRGRQSGRGHPVDDRRRTAAGRRWSCCSGDGGPAAAPRRPAALLVDAFGLSLVMLALLYVAGISGWPAFETIRLITFASLGLAPIAFLFALLDTRLARGEVAGLLVELRADPTTDLQAPLARALRDPSLRLAYWLPELGTWADQDGDPTACPAGRRPPGRADHLPGRRADGGAAVRPVAGGRAGAAGRRRGRRRHRLGERPAAGRAAGAAAGAAGLAGAGVRGRPAGTAAAGTRICTTGRSSGWWPCPSSWACWARGPTPTRPRGRGWPGPRRRCRRRWRSSATSPAASTRRC